MQTILQLNASLFGQGGQVLLRDLARQPVPHLTAERFAAFGTPASERTLEQRHHVAESDALIDELRRADVIVLGVPMYNFGVPSTLNEYVVATRGGQYAGTPRDLQSAHLRRFLAFIGIRDVQFICAEGLARGVEERERALAAAVERISQIAA